MTIGLLLFVGAIGVSSQALCVDTDRGAFKDIKPGVTDNVDNI